MNKNHLGLDLIIKLVFLKAYLTQTIHWILKKS